MRFASVRSAFGVRFVCVSCAFGETRKNADGMARNAVEVAAGTGAAGGFFVNFRTERDWNVTDCC